MKTICYLKKKFFFVLLIFLLIAGSLTAIRRKGHTSRDETPILNNNLYPIQPNRPSWDILFSFDCIEAGQPGIETDCESIYTSDWRSGHTTFYKYEMDGTFVDSFDISGATQIRDMAYDGEFFYGAAADMSLKKMDLANQVLVETINATCTGITGIRHIAYDPWLDYGNGGFWIGNWNELGAINMQGNEIYGNISPFQGSLYGSAYDPWTSGGPYLWLFSQNGCGAVLHQFEIATQIFTGVTHVCSDIPGFSSGIAGGCCTAIIDEPEQVVLFVNIQQEPNIIAGYELIQSWIVPPAAPTNVSVIPNPDGELETQIDWICPTVNLMGEPLEELTAMKIFRDELLIYTDTIPIIGGPGSYLDMDIPSLGSYTYSIVGCNLGGNGLPVEDTVWIGEDVPGAVTGFNVENASSGNELAALLSWTNPLTGLHGGVFNQPILGYLVIRSDSAEFELIGLMTDWTDDTVFEPEYYSYTVTPFNSVGSGGSATSPQVWIGEILSGILIIDPDPTPTGELLHDTIQEMYDNTVTYTTEMDEYPITENLDAIFILLGIHSNNYVLSEDEVGPFVNYLANGGNLYMEGGDTWFYDEQTTLQGLFGLYAYEEEFNDLYEVEGSDFLGGMEWSYSGENNCMDKIHPADSNAATIFVNTMYADTLGVRFDAGTYKTVGNAFEISGLGGTNSLGDALAGILDFFEIIDAFGTVEGNVSLEGASGNVEDVIIVADGISTHPNMEGNYSLTLLSGTYDLTASLYGYESQTIEDIEVEAGQIVSGLDFLLNFLAPPENLTASVVNNNNVILNWESPITNIGILYFHNGYDNNGVGTGPNSDFTCAARFTPEELTEYYGSQLTGVNIVMHDNNYDEVVVKVWEGGEYGDPGTEIYSEDVTGSVIPNEWSEFDLDPPINLISGNEYWIGYFFDQTGGYPAGVDSGPMVPNKGAWFGFMGTWDLLPLDLNWCIEGVVGNSEDFISKNRTYIQTETPMDNIMNTIPKPFQIANTGNSHNSSSQSTRDLLGYNVYRDDELINDELVTDTTYADLNLAEDAYEYYVTAVYDPGESEPSNIVEVIIGLPSADEIVKISKLFGNFPNPFSISTNISFILKNLSEVNLSIYNVKGQLVETLVNEQKNAGEHSVDFNAKNLSSGVYLYKIETDNFSEIKKAVLVK
ncbi:MAG: T9SS type A sorting domain-containing protein [Candidatus Cloacimonadota bacterium]|nr:T9SS type A sorting domain-containing protein [Candidatus Cloacimonadota bacterium]